MRRMLLAFLLVGCSSSTSEAPTDSGFSDSAALPGLYDTAGIEPIDASEPPDTLVIPDAEFVDAETAVEGKFSSELMFIGTSPGRSAWICVHAFTASDVTTATPFQSLGPIGVLDAEMKPIAPLTYGQAVKVRGDATLTAALKSLPVVASAHTTKPDDCKTAWPVVAGSPADWVLVPPKTIPSPYVDAAFTFGDRVRVYPVDANPVVGAYKAQLINEGADAALFEFQRKTESGTPIDTPVSLNGSGKIARYAIGAATPLTLPTTASFAASDLVVDSTPLSLFAPSLTRLTWAKEDGAGSLIVYAGTASAPTIILVPWI